MYHWRVTKYNPKYRDERGVYLKDEWIIFSEVGKSFENKIVTLFDYLEIETAYVEAILHFMDCLHLNGLKVTCLKKNKKPKIGRIYSQEMIDVFDKIKNRSVLSKEEVAIVARLNLREDLYCRFKSDDMYVHFGWDYYMYIGSKNACRGAITKIKKSGLFVESFKSPDLLR